MPPEGLGRRIVEPMGDVGDGEAAVFEHLRRVQQAHRGEIALGARQGGTGKAGHERAGPDAQAHGELSHGGGVGREPHEHLEEEAGIGRQVAEGREQRALDARRGAGDRLADHLAQACPPGGASDVHYLTDTTRPQAKEHFGGTRIVVGNEGDGRDAGKPAHELRDLLDVVGAALVHRDHERIHGTLAHHTDGVEDVVPVDDGETARAGRLDPRTLRRQEHGGEGRGPRRGTVRGGRHGGSRVGMPENGAWQSTQLQR